MTTLIVGAGDMAAAYAAVLGELGETATACCQSEGSAKRFSESTGIACVAGGIAGWQAEHGPLPTRAIVAVPVEKLASVAEQLLAAGCRRLLVEKPAGLDAREVDGLAQATQAADGEVFVAYNRRFYASVRMLREMAREDGGIVSLTFDFTELADRVSALDVPRAVLENWAIANSTHVIDTAFFLAGKPAKITGMTVGALEWHPSAARFAGHGVTQSGALFSYLADWDAPGRWGIEINTRLHKFVLRPMEGLQVQARNTFSLQPVDLADNLDTRFKPGLYRQTAAFLGGEGLEDLLPVAGHAANLRIIQQQILGRPIA